MFFQDRLTDIRRIIETSTYFVALAAKHPDILTGRGKKEFYATATWSAVHAKGKINFHVHPPQGSPVKFPTFYDLFNNSVNYDDGVMFIVNEYVLRNKRLVGLKVYDVFKAAFNEFAKQRNSNQRLMFNPDGTTTLVKA